MTDGSKGSGARSDGARSDGDQVGERAHAPTRAPVDWQQRCEASERELEGLVSALAHDMRAPLRAIDGFGRVLLERCASQLSTDGRDYLQFMREGATQMSRYIESLARLTRAARLDIRPLRTDLGDFAGPVIDSLRDREPSRQVEVNVAAGLSAAVDPTAGALLFECLLSNAWKFTSDRADARIQVGAVERGGETVFFVRDNGCGFNPATTDRNFLPFSGLRTAEQPAAFGIGLAIARRIVHRHGGRIWAESAVNEGATFYFTLATPPEGADPAA